jgi:hypothetical protein
LQGEYWDSDCPDYNDYLKKNKIYFSRMGMGEETGAIK